MGKALEYTNKMKKKMNSDNSYINRLFSKKRTELSFIHIHNNEGDNRDQKSQMLEFKITKWPKIQINCDLK